MALAGVVKFFLIGAAPVCQADMKGVMFHMGNPDVAEQNGMDSLEMHNVVQLAGSAKKKDQLGEQHQAELASASEQAEWEAKRSQKLQQVAQVKAEAKQRNEARWAEKKREQAEWQTMQEARRKEQAEQDARRRESLALASSRELLHEKAELRRKEAELGSLSASKYGSVEDLRGNLSESGEMDDVMQALRASLEAVQNATFLRFVNEAIEDLQNSIVRNRQSATAQTDEFIWATENESEETMLVLLPGFLENISQLVMNHQYEAMKLIGKVEDVMPVTLDLNVKPMVKFVSESPVTVNTSAFVSREAACGQVVSLVADVAPYYANLTDARLKLDTAARNLPLAASLSPDSVEAMSLVQSVMTLGYMETIGLDDSVKEIVGKLAPVVADRLRCTFPEISASAHVGSNALFVVAAMAASWLAL